jgi:glycosyltransferase involved in cell wall biosynthesis
LDLLVDSIPLVAQTYPHVEFLLVGDGQTREATEALVRERKVAAHVRFVGRAEYDLVPTWIAACDVCVVLHKALRSYPGDSMKLWEYLACGRPVVTTAGAGYGETIEALGAGVAAEPDNPIHLAEQLVRLLDDAELRANMGVRGRAAVLQQHTWDARAAELEAVCHRVAPVGGQAA